MEKNKNMETKQHAAKKPIDQEWNQRIKQKIPRDKWKWKYNLRKSMGFSRKKKRMKIMAKLILAESEEYYHLSGLLERISNLDFLSLKPDYIGSQFKMAKY